MRNFYKKMKICYIIAGCFIFIMIVPVSIYNAINKDWVLVLLALFAVIFMSAIATFILLYYRNIVVEVSFNEDNAIIKTNGRVYVLPSKNFTEIKDSKLFGRIFMSYADEEIKKKFIFQKSYSPFKKYSLDIDEMKKHMTSAIFK